MGDEWPFGPPRYVTYAQCRAVLESLGMDSGNADIGAAVGTAESSRDLSVVNNTPGTGDYSVGIWQINYYGSLYAGRVAEFGTPRQLVAGGIQDQAHACLTLWQQSGWRPWSTFNNGDYRKYLQGGGLPPGPRPGPNAPVNTAISPPTEDYSATVHAGGDAVHNLGLTYAAAALVLSRLKG